MTESCESVKFQNEMFKTQTVYCVHFIPDFKVYIANPVLYGSKTLKRTMMYYENTIMYSKLAMLSQSWKYGN